MFSTIGSSGEAAIQGSVAESLRGRRTSDTRGWAFEIGLLASLLICLLILGALILTVLTDGLPVYSDRGWEFL
ncbi:MAG: hypothetical protein ACRDPQ_04145, partial [Nocardioidaceae bacterium]